jgi:hypothetical protein
VKYLCRNIRSILACCPFVFILKSFPLSLWKHLNECLITDCREKLLLCVLSSTTTFSSLLFSWISSDPSVPLHIRLRRSLAFILILHSLANCWTHYHLSLLLDQDHSFCLKYFFAPKNIFDIFEKIFDNIPIGQKPLIWPFVQYQTSC